MSRQPVKTQCHLKDLLSGLGFPEPFDTVQDEIEAERELLGVVVAGFAELFHYLNEVGVFLCGGWMSSGDDVAASPGLGRYVPGEGGHGMILTEGRVDPKDTTYRVAGQAWALVTGPGP